MATKTRKPPPTRPTVTGLVPADQTPGRTITIGDFIIEQIRAGVDPINASGTVGVTPSEFQAWMREGSLAIARLNSGADWDKDFVPLQQDCALFADGVIRARSRHIATLSIAADLLARGGSVRTSTRTKSQGGQVVETNEVREVLLPDPDMLKWKLEKLEPGVYGSKATLNVTVTDLTDTETQADNVQSKMREIAAALFGAIETTATESGEGVADPRAETDPDGPDGHGARDVPGDG